MEDRTPVVTARAVVVVDDAWMEAEDRMERQQQAHLREMIAKHGSQEKYEAWCIAECRRERQARAHAVARYRVNRARRIRPVTAPTVRRHAPQSGRPRARRTSSSSTTSGSDPGGSDSDPPPPPRLSLWRHPRWGAVTPDLLRILLDLERGER